MRRILQILGMITVAIVAAAAIGAGALVYEARRLDAGSRAFVDNAVAAITTHWDKQELLDRAGPELHQSLKPGQLTSLFDAFSRLGPLVKYEGAKGEATLSFTIGAGRNVSASYVARGVYKNGSAAIRMLLVKRGGHWLIQGFHVKPLPWRPGRRGA